MLKVQDSYFITKTLDYKTINMNYDVIAAFNALTNLSFPRPFYSSGCSSENRLSQRGFNNPPTKTNLNIACNLELYFKNSFNPA